MEEQTNKRVYRVLASVTDKSSLDFVVKGLENFSSMYGHDFEILSTGGTAKALRGFTQHVREVSDFTGAPEILDGRVKTLHPKIHGGLLGRPTAEHQAEMAKHAIENIDLLIVNLYPFEATLAKPGCTFGEAIENIDIGGPAMVRSAAKNWERVTVLVDPIDYPAVMAELYLDGKISAKTRWRLAKKAWAHIALYDAAISNYVHGLGDEPPGDEDIVTPSIFPSVLTLQFVGGKPTRYGENPHQQGAFYRSAIAPEIPTIPYAKVHGGKELSFNNIADSAAAQNVVNEFSQPTVAIIKHQNPCGVASADRLADAYTFAYDCDPKSAFGGIVAVNDTIGGELAEMIAGTFYECVVAPGYSAEALAVLAKKKDLRIIETGHYNSTTSTALVMRTVPGGLLVQTPDNSNIDEEIKNARLATDKTATPDQIKAATLATIVAKHAKSNTIVLAQASGGKVFTVGIGIGQPNRVTAAEIAIRNANTNVVGSVAASEAFFPFRDTIDQLAKAGIRVVVQPGGSKRDDDSIAAANEHNVVMLMTGVRHFLH